MSNLVEYLKMVNACRQSKAAHLKLTLQFVERVSASIQEAYEAHHIQHSRELKLLEFNGLDEPQTSKVFKQILSYKHKGDYPIWRSFTETFYPEKE